MLRECIEGVTVGAVEDDACGTRPCLQVFPCFVDIGLIVASVPKSTWGKSITFTWSPFPLRYWEVPPLIEQARPQWILNGS